MLGAILSWLIVMGLLSLLSFLGKILRKPYKIGSSIITFLGFVVLALVVTTSIDSFDEDYYSVSKDYFSSFDDLISISNRIPSPMADELSEKDYQALDWIKRLQGIESLTDNERNKFYAKNRAQSENWSSEQWRIVYENGKFIDLFGLDMFNSMDYGERRVCFENHCVCRAYECLYSNTDIDVWNKQEIIISHFSQLADKALGKERDKVNFDKLPLYALGLVALYVLAIALYAIIRLVFTKWTNLRARKIFIFIASVNITAGVILLIYQYFSDGILHWYHYDFFDLRELPFYLAEFVFLSIPIMEYIYNKSGSTDVYFLVPRFIQKTYYIPNEAYLRAATIFLGIPLFCFCGLPFGAFALFYVIPAFLILTITDAVMWIIAGKNSKPAATTLSHTDGL